MSQPTETLEQELMALPSRERARIAHELIASLDSGVDEDAGDYWEKETALRLKQIDEDDVVLSAARDSLARARKALKE